MSGTKNLPKRSTMPVAADTSSLLEYEEKKKSRNPFKFLRSHSHHPDDKQMTRQRASTVGKNGFEKVVSPAPVPPIKRTHSVNKTVISVPLSPSPKKVSTAHVPNPFSKPSSDFPYIGTGSDIAAPRNPVQTHHGILGSGTANVQPTNASLSRAASFKDSKMVYNPYGINSRTPSQYSINSVSDDEKKNILPLPIQDPNQSLPEEFKQENSNFNEEYLIPEKGSSKDKKLGDGASAVVILVQQKKTLRSYALKKFVLLPHETPDNFYKRALKEYIIAKRVSENKHIAQTVALMKIQTTTSISRGWGFILEYCKGGDLFGLITRTGWKQYSLSEKYCVFKQVVYGVNHIHSKGIVHRDLKPENILIDENGVAKITDFGVAEYGLEDPDDCDSSIKLITSFVGSPPYVSPEVMNLKQPNNREDKYDPFKLDLWAVGMILFCLVYQGTPFKSASTQDPHYRDFLTAYSTYLSANPSFKNGDKNHGPGSEFKYAKDFQSSGASRVAWRLCDPDPLTRYTLKNILEDPWFISIETCCDENDDFDYDSSGSFRNDSFDSTAHFSDNSKNNSTRPSPVIKPKSMLDLFDVTSNTTPLHTLDVQPIPEENNLARLTDSSTDSRPTKFFIQDSASSQVLPPVKEAECESLSTSPTKASIQSHFIDKEFDNLHDRFQDALDLGLTELDLSDSGITTKISQNLSSGPHEPLTLNTSDNNKTLISSSSTGNNQITTPASLGGSSFTTSELFSPSHSNNILNSHAMQRASSFSSLASNRSNKSNSNLSLNGGKRRKKIHHHLDISNVSNHGGKTGPR